CGGAIRAMGGATANATLRVPFAEKARREGTPVADAAVDGAKHRLRPILMTSFAMIAGMVPMALGLGEGGEQTAPLGRAVIGGLAAATVMTLLVLPSLFAIVPSRAVTRSPSLHPADPESGPFRKGERHVSAPEHGRGDIAHGIQPETGSCPTSGAARFVSWRVCCWWSSCRPWDVTNRPPPRRKPRSLRRRARRRFPASQSASRRR